MLGYLVASCYAQVDTAFADECGDVGCGQEDERDGEVLDERDVEARVSVELDVTAGEEVEGCGVETALYGCRQQQSVIRLKRADRSQMTRAYFWGRRRAAGR